MTFPYVRIVFKQQQKKEEETFYCYRPFVAFWEFFGCLGEKKNEMEKMFRMMNLLDFWIMWYCDTPFIVRRLLLPVWFVEDNIIRGHLSWIIIFIIRHQFHA